MALSVDDYSSKNLIGSVYSKYSTDSIDTDMSAEETGYLDFDGYLQVLVAQMSNQDFNNSMSDSEFIQQMASYSMMEAIKQLSQQTALSYNSSLIGKAVTVSDSSGIPETGIVEAVTVTSKGCMLLVNGNQYSSDTVTDVVDGTVYSQLRQFIGHKVEVQYTDDKKNEITTSGKVTSVVVKGGNGYVILDNKNMYDMSYITKLLDGEDSSGSGTENEDGAPEAVVSDENGGSGLIGGNIGDSETSEDAAAAEADGTKSAEVEESAAASAYSVQRHETKGVTSDSQSTYDTLMRMLDETTENNARYKSASVLSQFASASVKSNADNMSYLLAQVDEPVAMSGLSSDSGRVPAPVSYNQYNSNDNYTESNNYTGSSTQESVIDGDYVYSDNSIKTSAASTGYDSGEEYGVTSVSDSKASSASLDTYSSSVSYENVPSSSRKYADKYPVEAAFADSVRTNMIDIRFIGNTSVNSVIDTSEILCYSAKGRAVTDLGFSGKGRLGEVVTFADGTQRVEIIGPHQNGYLYTSGKYTLDEICNPHAAPGSLRDLTDFEIAIRHYAKEYTAAEEAEMKQFEQYAVRHAAMYGLG